MDAFRKQLTKKRKKSNSLSHFTLPALKWPRMGKNQKFFQEICTKKQKIKNDSIEGSQQNLPPNLKETEIILESALKQQDKN